MRERERGNNKYIESNMKRRKFKIKDIVMTHKHQIIQVILCNIITLYFYTLSFYNNKNEKKKEKRKKKR